MTSNIYNQQIFKPTPPERGSFPLDHDSVCKKYYLLYTTCLRHNKGLTSKCREHARQYLDCRMRNQLMETRHWSKLGFEDTNCEEKSTLH